MSNKQEYTIYYIKKRDIVDLNQEIQFNEDEKKEEFKFFDYDSTQTIRNLKEYFLSNFGHKYKLCYCQLNLLRFSSRNTLASINENDSKKLSRMNFNKLYLIRNKEECNCQNKNFNENYYYKSKYDLIKKLNDLIKENEEIKDLREYEKALIDDLKKKNFRINKCHELDYLNPEDFYDVIIDIKSIKDIKIGWEIKMKEKGRKKYEDFKDKKLLKIGVIGNSKSGKSFLLSKISDFKLMVGASIQTNGLSIKYPDNHRNLILLDSCGMEKPVFKNNINIKENQGEDYNKKIEENKIYKERAKDKVMTELFLQNFITKNSDILIVVVGNLTFSEQLLIEKIKEESKNKRDKIFIIHNLQFLRKIEQVENYINDTLYKCIHLEKQKPILKKDKQKENKKENKINDDDDVKENKKIENKIEDIEINNKIEEDIKEDEKIKKEKNEKEIIFDKNDNYNLIQNSNSFNEINLKIKNDIKENEIKNEDEDDNEIENLENNIDNEEKNNNIINNNNIEIKNNNEINNNIEIDKNEDNKINNIEIQNKNKIIERNKEMQEEKEKWKNIKKEGVTHYYEVLHYNNKKIDIYHLILANEDSDAGLFYNQYTYEFIENFYNTIIGLKNFDIFDEIKNEFKIVAPNIINEKIDKFIFNKNEDIIKNKIIKLELEKELTLKNCYIGDNFSLFNINNFQPKYNYFKPDENTLEIRLEIPGNATCEIETKVENNQTNIIITGVKEPDMKPENPKDNIVNLREFTDYKVVIPLPVEEFQISSEETKEPEFKNGLCIIQFKLIQKGKKKVVKVEGV